MNVQNNYRKALIAFTASLSCLLIYVLACVMSPPSWSPDSSKIAILVTPPENEPNMYAIYTYDIATGEHLLLDEVQANGSLSTPAWSPDGNWIAYYRIEPDTQAENVPSDSNSTSPATLENTDESIEMNEQTGSKEIEENNILPSFLFDVIEDYAKKKKDASFVDMKLMLIRPDGSEKRTLNIVKLESESNNSVTLLQPVWSNDSKRLFYMRGYRDLWYAGSIDISTGKTCLNLLTSGKLAVSPDNKWLASFIADNILVIAAIDGNICKYCKLDFEIDSDNLYFMEMFWSSDSKNVFIAENQNSLYAVDTDSGQSELFVESDPNSENAYYTLSSTGQELYYLTKIESENNNVQEENIELKYMNLGSGRKGTLFTFKLPDINDELAMFSIAPNGKIVLLRAIIKDDNDIERTALIFFDGKTQKIVETDNWLVKP